MFRIFVFIICAYSYLLSLSQDQQFRIDISTYKDDYIMDLIEVDNQFLVLGFSGDYVLPDYSFIYVIQENGDTSSFRYSLNDTIVKFQKIIHTNSNQYLAFGSCAWPPDYKQDFIIAIMDEDFHIVSYSVHNFPGYDFYQEMDLKASQCGIYIVSMVKNTVEVLYSTLICKIDESGDLLKSIVFDDENNSHETWDFDLSQDCSQIWLFGTGFNWSGGLSRISLDTNFQVSHSQFLPHQLAPNLNVMWYTDSTLLFNSKYYHWNSNPQDDDIAISITDTSFSEFEFQLIGALDTIDYPAWGQSIDFIHRDSIFYTGMHNKTIDFYPEIPSWIIIGQNDSTLTTRFEYYYGGDAYYGTTDILSTQDGGCLVASLRYDYLTQNNEFDAIIIKYRREDLITSINENQTCSRALFIYPNPGLDHLYVPYPFNKGTFQLFDSFGKLVTIQKLNHGRNTISCSDLNSGSYYYLITDNNTIVFSGKWIKL